MTTVSLLLAVCLGAEAAHAEANTVFRELIGPGVEFPAGEPVPLPEPTLADGADAAAARRALEQIPERRVSVDQLFRRSVVAPIVLRFREIEPVAGRPTVRGVDLWYVAYGDFHLLLDEDFLDSLAGQEEGEEGEVHVLETEELKRRGIAPPAEDDRQQRYVFASFPLLDQVRLSATSRHFMTRTNDSLLVVSKLEPRFIGDEEYPNQWRPMNRQRDGSWQLGEPRPYEGAGACLKITRLTDPPGAMLVEMHTVFAEPEGWFGGRNLLKSKLPLVLQSKVREFRRRLVKASAD